jgi:hypothetical protein
MSSVRYDINDIKDGKHTNRFGFIKLGHISNIDIDNTSNIISIDMINGKTITLRKKDLDYDYGIPKINQLIKLHMNMNI